MTTLFLGLGLAALIFSLPGGLLTGLAGRTRWLWFWLVGAVFVLLETALFSSPGPGKMHDLPLTALLFGSATLIEGLAFRAAFRAVARWRARRGG